MPLGTEQANRCHPTRREAVGLLASMIAGLALGGCMPLRIVVGPPPRYKRNSGLTDQTLAAFAATVVPGQSAERDAAAAEVFHDAFYPIAPYRAFLASDLDRRAGSRFHRSFRSLQPVERTQVVSGAIGANGLTRQLYTGAIFLIQIATYGGIENDRAGCELIGFGGGYRLPTRSELTYAEVERFRATALTSNGNPA